jgi:hypothetical protein
LQQRGFRVIFPPRHGLRGGGYLAGTAGFSLRRRAWAPVVGRAD